MASIGFILVPSALHDFCLLLSAAAVRARNFAETTMQATCSMGTLYLA
jgi:hypothetical protein